MRTQSVSSTLVLALAGVLALSGCRKEANDDSNVAKDPTSGAATDAMPGPAATPPASDQAAQSTATGAASTDGAAMTGSGVTVSSVAVGTVAAAEPDGETPAEHLMEHNGDLEPTEDDARDEEAAELKREHDQDDKA